MYVLNLLHKQQMLEHKWTDPDSADELSDSETSTSLANDNLRQKNEHIGK